MKVFFIVKPISNYALKQLYHSIETTFDKKKDSIHILKTSKKEHAIDLTQKAINEKPDVVVACGGDGTVNEVARGLVKTEIPIAVVPVGSGNGIARHFKIPSVISNAIQLIKKKKIAKMDVGVVNGHYFFGNMGCALESHFIRIYNKNGSHGIWAYMIAFFNAIISFKYQKILIEYQKEIKQISPFVFLVSNTNQQGYNFSLTPKALSDDGQLDLFWIEKSSLIKKIKFMINTLLGMRLKSNDYNFVKLSMLKISLLDPGNFCIQIDGEYLSLTSKNLEVEVIPEKLNVIVP
ncbi:MAG: YegS/Rv2252/BmrU family lipid kinase [Bacteroidota bacterium]|nr:YegS/Rv2252/BmrU family lipid kinase [Bacteroidota bacterium]